MNKAAKVILSYLFLLWWFIPFIWATLPLFLLFDGLERLKEEHYYNVEITKALLNGKMWDIIDSVK